jgi:hypothetical protein
VKSFPFHFLVLLFFLQGMNHGAAFSVNTPFGVCNLYLD